MGVSGERWTIWHNADTEYRVVDGPDCSGVEVVPASEVARLTEALREIAESGPEELDLSHSDGGFDLAEIARAALHPEKETE